MKRLATAVAATSGLLLVFGGPLGALALPIGHVHVWSWWALQELGLLLVCAASLAVVRPQRPRRPAQPVKVVKPRGLTNVAIGVLLVTGLGYLVVYVFTLPTVSAAHRIARHPGHVTGRIDDVGSGKYSSEYAVFTVDGSRRSAALATTDTLHFRLPPDGRVGLVYDTQDPSTVMTESGLGSSLHGTDFWLYALGWIPAVLSAHLYGFLWKRQGVDGRKQD